MKFNQSTFKEFTREKQGKKLIELITKIDAGWQNEPLRKEMMKELQSLMDEPNE